MINFEWKNLRTGKVIRERKGFEAVGRYVPVHPVGEDIRSAELQAADAAAQAIVLGNAVGLVNRAEVA